MSIYILSLSCLVLSSFLSLRFYSSLSYLLPFGRDEIAIYNFPPCLYLVLSCLVILACLCLCLCIALSSCPVYVYADDLSMSMFMSMPMSMSHLRLCVFRHPCLCLRLCTLSCLIFNILNKSLIDLAQLRQVHSKPCRNTHRKPNYSSTSNPNACHHPNQVHGSRMRTYFSFFLPLLADF